MEGGFPEATAAQKGKKHQKPLFYSFSLHQSLPLGRAKSSLPRSIARAAPDRRTSPPERSCTGEGQLKDPFSIRFAHTHKTIPLP